MKRLALITLSLSLALSNFVSANDDGKKVQVQKQNRGQQPVSQARVQRVHRVHPVAPHSRNFSNSAARAQFQAQRNQAQRNGRHLNSDYAQSHIRSRNFSPPVAPPQVTTATVPQPNVGVSDGARGTSRWRNGRGNQDWQNGSGSGNQDWRNGTGAGNHGGNRTGAGTHDWRKRKGDFTQNSMSGVWENRTNHRRHWDRSRRHRSWWTSHYNRFSLFGGGYYYFDSGFWYPAYGYDPYFSTYSYDAPIYGYNDLEPAQVIANVQAQLQASGYYRGELDGQFGPETRRALLDYQRDNGLPVTGEIDEATLDSLGLQ